MTAKVKKGSIFYRKLETRKHSQDKGYSDLEKPVTET